MNLIIKLSKEFEELLKQAARAAGMDVEAFAQKVFIERLTAGVPDNDERHFGTDDFRRRLDEIASLTPAVKHIVDDSRESIYDGCGE